MRIAAILLLLTSPLFADNTDLLHVKLDIELDPVARTISGTATHTARSEVAGLRRYRVRLHPNLQASAATCNGAATTFTRRTNEVLVDLDRSYNPGESFDVSITYGGTPASGGFSSFGFGVHGSPPAPFIFSLSEPWYAYTWWPCKETLTDKFTVEMWVTVPSSLIAASNGLLQGTDALSGNRTRYRWSHTYPIATYGVSIAISNYRTRTDTYVHPGGAMPVEHYIYPERWNAELAGMNRIVPMIATQSRVFGEYPFVREKYGVAMFSWSGGMEHQTITSQSDFSEDLSIHELSHSWWGNMITCATWNDIWLNEGFATYGEALYYEFRPGGSPGAYFGHMGQRRPTDMGGTVYVYNPSSVGRIFDSNNVYRKGAWVLHQLRHLVGDSAFFQILRDYRSAKEYASATTAEFTAIASASSGQDLGWFIDQCVMRPGAPSYDVGWRHEVVNGQDYVFLHLEQTQDSFGWDLYRFPIDIYVYQNPTTFTHHRIWNDSWRDEYVLAVPGAPWWVRFDPESWILRGGDRLVPYAPSLQATPATIPAGGGSTSFGLDGGPHLGGRPYLLLGSLSGIHPGIALPGSKVLPLIADPFSDLLLFMLNTPVFAGFQGLLDSAGRAAPRMTLPPIDPSAIGTQLYFAFATLDEPYFTSAPAIVTIGP